jgi:hypothetical protein
VVPAFGETGLDAIQGRYGNLDQVEVIFALADGDAATTIPDGAKAIRGPKGRASQMNAGAAIASGDILLFLHADTSIPPQSLDGARLALANPKVAAGAYSLRVDGPGWWFAFISAIANLRSRRFAMPFGDQAIFLTKETFLRIGGYENIPILEDVRLVEAAAKLGQIIILPAIASTSPRKWLSRGKYVTTARHWLIMISHRLQPTNR